MMKANIKCIKNRLIYTCHLYNYTLQITTTVITFAPVMCIVFKVLIKWLVSIIPRSMPSVLSLQLQRQSFSLDSWLTYEVRSSLFCRNNYQHVGVVLSTFP